MKANRFTGQDGHRLLCDALERQVVVNGDTAIAAKLADVAELMAVSTGAVILSEGDSDTDIYFLLIGEVAVLRGGRHGPRRVAGECFGEMAAIDVQSKRSATVIATEDATLARVPQARLVEIADAHPRLWRSIALQITDRLRQRLADIVPRNDQPRVFIGSSVEGLAVAEAIQNGLKFDDVTVQLWTNEVFRASTTSIEALEIAVRQADFAVLVLTPDDKMEVRGEARAVPRDNIIFELGLFMGALGRHRSFVVTQHGAALQVPTDLLGVTPLTHLAAATRSDTASKVGPLCTELRKIIAELGPK